MTKLIWIRRRARRILHAYHLPPNCAKARRVAVKAAAEDWVYFNPGK